VPRLYARLLSRVPARPPPPARPAAPPEQRQAQHPDVAEAGPAAQQGEQRGRLRWTGRARRTATPCRERYLAAVLSRRLAPQQANPPTAGLPGWSRQAGAGRNHRARDRARRAARHRRPGGGRVARLRRPARPAGQRGRQPIVFTLSMPTLQGSTQTTAVQLWSRRIDPAPGRSEPCVLQPTNFALPGPWPASSSTPRRRPSAGRVATQSKKSANLRRVRPGRRSPAPGFQVARPSCTSCAHGTARGPEGATRQATGRRRHPAQWPLLRLRGHAPADGRRLGVELGKPARPGSAKFVGCNTHGPDSPGRRVNSAASNKLPAWFACSLPESAWTR